MVKRSCVVLALATLIACGGNAEHSPSQTEGSAQDAGHLCENDGGSYLLCRDGVVAETVQLPCLYSLAPIPSAALIPTCLVAPDGTLYLALLRGDLSVSTPGWTIEARDAYSPASLNAQDKMKCEVAKTANRALPHDGGITGCSFP